MGITLHPICGMQVGIELTEADVNNIRISYLLIDIFILRIQCAWYKDLDKEV